MDIFDRPLGGTHAYRVEPETFDRPRYVATPQDAANAWEQSATAGATKWANNLQNTQKDIVGRAIAQKQVMAANFATAVNDGSWERALQAVGNAGIKAAAAAKSGNYSTGVSAAKSKMLSAMQKIIPAVTQAQAIVDAMPSGNIGASKARVNAYIDYMHSLKGSLGA